MSAFCGIDSFAHDFFIGLAVGIVCYFIGHMEAERGRRR